MDQHRMLQNMPISSAGFTISVTIPAIAFQLSGVDLQLERFQTGQNRSKRLSYGIRHLVMIQVGLVLRFGPHHYLTGNTYNH